MSEQPRNQQRNKDQNPDQDKDYDVGYGKPPKHSQFKPGQSGNPKGRPKRTKDLEKLVDRELEGVVSITENGEIRKITKRQALLKKIVNDAFKNDYRAIKLLMPYMQNARENTGFEVDAAGKQALERYMQQQLEQSSDDASQSD